ncbi:MAG: carbohydrate ABC transporter permease [Chloroflexota bacterium]|nr:MAG: carbohydrate ABC transporter permease [Chloroflexota bacterium]
MSTATATDAAAAGRARREASRRLWRLVVYAMLVVGSLVYAFPLLLMLRTSLTPVGMLMADPPVLFPWPPYWENYVILWEEVPIPRWLANSTQITVISVLAETITSTLVAFGFARTHFRGRDKLFYGVLATMMLPTTVTLVPQFILYQSLGWINTFWPLIVPRFFGTAFYIFILRQFFLALPRELDDAAEIDGANRLQILLRIVVPLSGPAIATVAVFSFMNRWNDFLEPVIYLFTPENLTLAVGLRWFTGRHGTEFHLLMAGALLMTAPMIVAFFLAQKHFVRGIALTGIKG